MGRKMGDAKKAEESLIITKQVDSMFPTSQKYLISLHKNKKMPF